MGYSRSSNAPKVLEKIKAWILLPRMWKYFVCKNVSTQNTILRKSNLIILSIIITIIPIIIYDHYFIYFIYLVSCCYYYYCFLPGFSFTNIHELQDWRGMGRAFLLINHYHFHPLLRHLDISRVITAESSPLHIASIYYYW